MQSVNSASPLAAMRKRLNRAAAPAFGLAVCTSLMMGNPAFAQDDAPAVSATVAITIAMTLPPGTLPGTYSGSITFDVLPLTGP